MEILKFLQENKDIIFNKTHMIMYKYGYKSCCCNSVMILNDEKFFICSTCKRVGTYM